MPRARRNKVVSLTQTSKKTKADKESFADKVRDAANTFSYAWLFTIGNMRNSYIKEVRQLWEGSRIFYGKLGVVRYALGTEAQDEVRPGISALSNRLVGQVGILFTDSPPEEVQDWFDTYSRKDFARTGNIATETVTLSKGPVQMRTTPPENLPHPIEPQLRQLGMPTELQRGVPTLLRDYTVCKAGDKLTKESAQILKLLLIQQAEFRIVPLAYWSASAINGQPEGSLTEIQLSDDQKALIEQSGANSKAVGQIRSKNAPGSKAGQAADDDDDDDEEDIEIEDGDQVGDDMMLPANLR